MDSHASHRRHGRVATVWVVVSASALRATASSVRGLYRQAGASWTPSASRTEADDPTKGLSAYLDSSIKRALDLFVASLTLLMLLPLLGSVAALIRLTSGGPALYRQTRCGKDGRPFTIYKFRSMYVDEGPETGFVTQATRADARITPIGRFIRRTSIDELPQLINVLRGDMSLIGPRPHARSHDEHYGALIGRYGDRFAARPGLSGLAQISGARGATPHVSDMERRVELDLAYVRSATLGTDLRILVMTAREMLFSSSAY